MEGARIYPKAMLARLAAGRGIDPHTDGSGMNPFTHKIHVPPETNPRATLAVAGAAFHLEAGHAWEVNNLAVHGAFNGGGRDRIHIQSGFDVYLDDGTLVYVKVRCTPEDVVDFIFLKVFPASPEDLLMDRRRKGFRHDRLFNAFPERFGDRCLAGISLPTYPVDHIVTGQRELRSKQEQGRLVNSIIWKAEAALGAGG